MVSLFQRRGKNSLAFVLCLFVLFAMGPAHASEESSALVNEGRALLSNGRNPVYSAALPAHAKFEAAIQADPTDQTAHFFYAFSGLLVFALEEGDGVGLDNLAELASAMGAVRSSNDFVSEGPPYLPPLDENGKLDLASTCPTGSQTMDFLSGPFLNALSETADRLRDHIKKDWQTTLTTAEIGGDSSVEIDYGDVLLFRSALSFAKSAILLASAYNVEIDYRNLINLYKVSFLNIQRDVLDAYLDLFKLLPSGGTEALSNARTAFLEGIDLYRSAYAFILAETDNQNNDLVYLGDQEDRIKADHFLDILQEIVQSLHENRIAELVYTKETWILTDALGESFELRIKKDSKGNWLDVSLEGRNVTKWTLDGATVKIQYSSFSWDYWCSCSGTMTGTFSGTHIDGNYIVYCCYGAPSINSYTGELQTTVTDPYAIDLNRIFGGPEKAPLDIRAAAPSFGWCNRVLPGTFPPTNDSYPVLNGIFPDILTNAELTSILELKQCDPITLSVTVDPMWGGAVRSGEASPLIDCPAQTCEAGYELDSTVTLTAIPNEGWVFDQWDDGITLATRTVTMDMSKSLAAKFVDADTAQSGLTVAIFPGAAAADARWKVDDGPWMNSGATVGGLSIGAHTITFEPIPGWTTPASQNVWISAGHIVEAAGFYVPQSAQTGSLTVAILPLEAVAVGAQWMVDNNGSWKNSGEIVDGLTAGAHTITFKETDHWIAPPAQDVVITGGQIATPTVSYTADFDEYEPDNAMEEAKPIGIGETQTHTLDYYIGDTEDWVSFEAEAGSTYIIQTANLGTGRKGSSYFELYDAEYNYLASGYSWSPLTWTAQSEGTYYVRVSLWGGDCAYDISVTLRAPIGLDEYEPDNSMEEAKEIGIGETQTHTLDSYNGDTEDWISFEAEAGATYTIKTANLRDGDYTVIQLYNHENTLLASKGYGQGPIIWAAQSEGVYYIRVGFYGWDCRYDISVTLGDPAVLDEYEPDNSISEAKTIGIGETQTHTLDSYIGDTEDWISFTADEGAIYTIQTANLGASSKSYPYFELYDAEYNYLDSGYYWRPITWAAQSEGTYYVKVMLWSGDCAYDISVTLRAPIGLDEYEPDNSVSIAKPIGIGATQTHTLDSYNGDTEDWISFTAEAGSMYTIKTANLRDGNSYYTILQLYDAGNNQIAYGNTWSSIIWMPESSGTYYVRVSLYEIGDCRYDISVHKYTPIGLDEYEPDNSMEEATPILLGEPQTHTLDYYNGDTEDWMSFEAEAGATYTIKTANLRDGDNLDTVLELYDAAGNLLAENDDCTRSESCITWTAESPGTYYVKAMIYESYGDCRYDISVSFRTPIDSDESEPDNTMPESKPINIGEPQTNTLVYNNGDTEDWMSFEAEVGSIYTIRTANLRDGDNLDTVLELYDAAGNLIAENDDCEGPESCVTWTPESSGTYYVKVRLYGSRGDCRYDISVTVTTPTTCLTVTINPTEALTAGGKWRVDDGAWQDSGTTLCELALGAHTITFKDLAGWTTPTAQEVTLIEGQTGAATGTYVPASVQTGSINVTITPAEAVSAGAKWKFAGEDAWRSPGTVTGIALGSKTVEFKPLSGWTTPNSVTVSISAETPATASGGYSLIPAQTGSLTVAITPAEAVAAGAQWKFAGEDSWRNPGAVTGIGLGSKTVEFKAISGWTTPASVQVTISADTPATATGTYALIPAQTGSLTVSITPAEAVAAGAKWKVVGQEAWRESGATVTDLPVGEVALEFLKIPGWAKPGNKKVSITTGQTTTISESYSELGLSITVTDPVASESKVNGLFTITRYGDISKKLVVTYTVSGSATNGKDYKKLKGKVTIKKNSSTASIIVKPKNDKFTEEVEDVTLTLSNGESATVTIEDND